MNDKWQVNLEIFEGPLDLLLHLINKFEIDIYDIPIKDITNQYLHYIRAMQFLQLDVAGEYLVMAATLMSIKSQLLLPRNEEWEEESEVFEMEEDSLETLQQKLLEYRKFKFASQKLSKKREQREHYYSKNHSDLTQHQQAIPLTEGELTLEDLIGAFGDLLKKKEWLEPKPSTIELEEVTISEKIEWLNSQFNNHKKRISFRTLLNLPTKKELVVTFLAVLELIKENKLLLEQHESFGEIYLSSVSA